MLKQIALNSLSPLQERLLAFFAHLVLSTILLITLLLIIYFYWFPKALSQASGGIEGLTIIILVDMVLGPVLTLIVYNPSKPKIKLTFDIGAIVAAQLVCMVIGANIVHDARPIAVVHVFDTFHVINQHYFESEGIDTKAIKKLKKNSLNIFYVEVAENPVAFSISKIHNDLNKKNPFHLKIEDYKEIPKDRDLLTHIFKLKSPTPTSECLTQNIKSLYSKGTICFNPLTGEFTDFKEGESISVLDNVNIKVVEP